MVQSPERGAELDAEFVKLCLGGGLLVTLVVAFTNRPGKADDASSGNTSSDERFRTFQRTYLAVYLMATMADWLQGPFVYALYESYEFSRTDNGLLFTAGFASSAVFGTAVGSLADRMGRRKFAALYCALYAFSCMTKHVKSFSVLLLGRITGGVATSLLFSVFDSWMVSEHNHRSFGPELLGSTFSLAVFGNSMIAIAAGEVGQLAADMLEQKPFGEGSSIYYGGLCTPFDVAAGFCGVCLLAMSATWSENYGDYKTGASGTSVIQALGKAVRTIKQSPQVLYCGVVCSFFEASMFIFVFMWTPALTREGSPKPPYGHIFAAFMVMCMLGSQIYSLASATRSAEELGRVVLMLAAACHAVPVFFSDVRCSFLAFLAFEMCVGMYFPMMGTMKGSLVPEESRSTIYNLYRVPLNLLVVATLVTRVELQTAFVLTTALLLAAFSCQLKLQGSRVGHYQPVGMHADPEFGLDDPDLIGGKREVEEELSSFLNDDRGS